MAAVKRHVLVAACMPGLEAGGQVRVFLHLDCAVQIVHKALR